MSNGITVTGLGLASGATAISNGYTVQYVYDTPSGIQSTVSLKTEDKSISPALYMKYVKSKLGKVHIEKVKRRMAKVQRLISYAKDMGQRALYESLCEEIAVLVRECEIVSFGINTWVESKDIDKFRGLVKDRVIQWNPLEKFPRVIPKSVQAKVRKLEKAKVFDEFWILYIDYTGEKLTTTKEKIRSKDPILFGKLLHQPNRLYFIADWVDEYCDLTLNKFVERFKEDDPDYGVSRVEDITDERLKAIVEEVKARHQRLADTNISNWRELEEKEAQAPVTALKDAQSEHPPASEDDRKSEIPHELPKVVRKKPFWKIW
jgi:hypothetical protein